MDPNLSDALLDKIVEKVIEKLAMDGGLGGLGPETEDYGAGIGDTYVPGPEGLGGPIGEGLDDDLDGPAPDLGDEGDGGPPPVGAADTDEPEEPGDPDGDEGEPVTDDLDEEEDEDDEESDMDEPAAKGKAKAKTENYNSGCETAPPADAKRKREQYAGSVVGIDRLADEIQKDRVRYAKQIKRLEGENAQLKHQVQVLQAQREGDFRMGVLNSLRIEGYELDADKEFDRTCRYSRDQFNEHVEVIRERYRKGDPVVDDEPLPVADMVRYSASPEDRESVLDEARKIAALAAREGISDPAVALERYRAGRKA